MDLIFFGMQGAGKGTLGKSVCEKYGLQLFETGGELRRLAASDTELGHKIKSIIEAGHLVSNEVVMEIVENFLNNHQSNSPILFDGIPRQLEQAKTLNALLEKHHRIYKAVIIDINRATALKRLTTRRIDPVTKKVYPADYPHSISEDGNELITRSDDNPEAIETRLKLYEEETLPVLNLYADKLLHIDGEPPIEEVKQNAFKVLDPLYT